MPNILITTVGNSFGVIPEILGFTNTQQYDLYENHQDKSIINQERQTYAIEAVDEIWAVGTASEACNRVISGMYELCNLVYPNMKVNSWRVNQISDLNSPINIKKITELIYRTVLEAHKRIGNGKLYISIAGGRKTMSADLQQAGALMGCNALLHVIDNGYAGLSENEKQKLNRPHQYMKPLEKKLASLFTPVVISGRIDSKPWIMEQFYDVYHLPEPKKEAITELEIEEPNFYNELMAKQKDADHLLFNYTAEAIEGAGGTNFRKLYAFPPKIIKALRNTRIGNDENLEKAEKAFMQKLPKSDLHIHLGGIASPQVMIDIACAHYEQIETYKQRSLQFSLWLKRVEKAVDENNLSALTGCITHPFDAVTQKAEKMNLSAQYKKIRKLFRDVPEPYTVYGFLSRFSGRACLLEKLLYEKYQNEEKFVSVGFDVYEQLGDLQGSAILQTEKAFRVLFNYIKSMIVRENYAYIEFRCSPGNYTKGELSRIDVVHILLREMQALPCRSRMIFIASRHRDLKSIEEHVNLAKERIAADPLFAGSFAGFDLAGSEKLSNPASVRKQFKPLLKDCINITIHAGEGEPVDNIWEAVYELHADRIGHGLTLGNNKKLLNRFRDWNIGVEMCPSSNYQIVGFRDYLIPSTDKLDSYPLKYFLDNDVRITINTDNPGISRTTISNEYCKAARMTEGGLSWWDVLQIVKNGFRSAFIPTEERRELMLEVEDKICELIKTREWDPES